MAALRVAVLCVAFVTLNAMNPSPVGSGQTAGGAGQGAGNNMGAVSTSAMTPNQQPNMGGNPYAQASNYPSYPSMNYQPQNYMSYPNMNPYNTMQSSYPTYPRMQGYQNMNQMSGRRSPQQPANNMNSLFLPLALSGNDAAANMAFASAMSRGNPSMWSALALGGGLSDTMQQALLYSNLGRQGGANSFGGIPYWALSGMDLNNMWPLALGGFSGMGGQSGQSGQGRAGQSGQSSFGLNNPAMLGLYLGGNF